MLSELSKNINITPVTYALCDVSDDYSNVAKEGTLFEVLTKMYCDGVLTLLPKDVSIKDGDYVVEFYGKGTIKG